MVLFFTPRRQEFMLYMGRDKVENEDLIAYGLPEDIWFHVDALSSAHVYVRLPEGLTIEDIDDETLEDCCQLVKANSIQGNKENDVDIVYTPWGNLKKTPSMEVGQVRNAASSVERDNASSCTIQSVMTRGSLCHHLHVSGRLPQSQGSKEVPCREAHQRNRKPAQQDQAGRVPRP